MLPLLPPLPQLPPLPEAVHVLPPLPALPPLEPLPAIEGAKATAWVVDELPTLPPLPSCPGCEACQGVDQGCEGLPAAQDASDIFSSECRFFPVDPETGEILCRTDGDYTHAELIEHLQKEINRNEHPDKVAYYKRLLNERYGKLPSMTEMVADITPEAAQAFHDACCEALDNSVNRGQRPEIFHVDDSAFEIVAPALTPEQRKDMESAFTKVADRIGTREGEPAARHRLEQAFQTMHTGMVEHTQDPNVTEWFPTNIIPRYTGQYEIQVPFGEICRLHYDHKKHWWYYPNGGASCCAGDSLHIIACAWRASTVKPDWMEN